MGVKISALPTATQAEAASGLIPVVTDPNGDGNLITKHVTASSIGGGATVDTGTTPPSNPGNGDLWFDEGNAELYIYNTSINGWIQTNGGGGDAGGDTPSVLGARAVFCSVLENSGGWVGDLTIAPSSFNIDRIENTTSNFTGYTIYFTNPIENPVIIVPDFQPDYDKAPFASQGLSRRVDAQSVSNGSPSYRAYFQDSTSNILTAINFTASSGTTAYGIRHFVIF